MTVLQDSVCTAKTRDETRDGTSKNSRSRNVFKALRGLPTQRYSCVVIPPFDPATGRLPLGEHPRRRDEIVDRNEHRRSLLDGLAEGAGHPSPRRGRVAPKRCFRGEFFPNVVEAHSGLAFSEFFQSDRETGRKGTVLLTIGAPA